MLATYLLLTTLAAQPKLDLVKVYCYSVESESGFIDERTEKYCKNLDKDGNKEGVLTVVDSKEASDMSVIHGDVTSHTSNSSLTTRIPYTNLTRTETHDVFVDNDVVVVGEFSKSFQGNRIRDQIIDWVKLNQAIILEKSRESK